MLGQISQAGWGHLSSPHLYSSAGGIHGSKSGGEQWGSAGEQANGKVWKSKSFLGDSGQTAFISVLVKAASPSSASSPPKVKRMTALFWGLFPTKAAPLS